MPDSTKPIDLYLWIIPNSNTLYKISNLTKEEADLYANRWLEMNELHDYMYVLEGSTPWTEPAPTIIDKSPEWISLQEKELNGSD